MLCDFFSMPLSNEFEICFFVNNLILCDPILKTCVFLVQTLMLLNSRFESRTDANDKPYIIQCKVNEVSTFVLPDLFQQKTH